MVLLGALVLTPLWLRVYGDPVSDESKSGEGGNGVPVDLYARLEAYEAGKLSQDEIFRLFQELINAGLINDMGQDYQQKAKAFVDVGLCTLPIYWN